MSVHFPPSSVTSLTVINKTRLSLVNIKEMIEQPAINLSRRRTREEQKKKKVMGEKKKKGCERCREWQEHYYKEHMDATKIRFVRIMAGHFEHRISIPEKYADSLNVQNIAKGFTLKAASGKTWRVGVTEIEDRLFFMAGWEDFATAHGLQENDILFFKCSGSHSFDVLIFDASGCEKVSSFFTRKRGPYMRKHFDDIVSDQQAEEHRFLTDSDNVSVPLLKSVGSPNKASTSKKLSVKTTKPREEPESPNSSDDQAKGDATDEESDDEHDDSNKYYSRSFSYLTDSEQEEIFRLASVKSGNPAYVTILQKSHVRRHNHILVIPSKFAAEHLAERSHEILLLRPNRNEKWCVRYYHASSSRGFNGMLWAKFVRDNKLHEGYICIFELIKGARKATMMVHVIRRANDGRCVLLG